MFHKKLPAPLSVMGLIILAWSLAGCMTMGHYFPEAPVSLIKIGETTRADVNRLFGSPWRTGVDSGKKTWTYGYYRYSLFGAEITRDLVFRFDDQGVVASYTFNRSSPETERQRPGHSHPH